MLLEALKGSDLEREEKIRREITLPPFQKKKKKEKHLKKIYQQSLFPIGSKGCTCLFFYLKHFYLNCKINKHSFFHLCIILVKGFVESESSENSHEYF